MKASSSNEAKTSIRRTMQKFSSKWRSKRGSVSVGSGKPNHSSRTSRSSTKFSFRPPGFKKLNVIHKRIQNYFIKSTVGKRANDTVGKAGKSAAKKMFEQFTGQKFKS